MRSPRIPTITAGLLLTLLVAAPAGLRAADGTTRPALDLAWSREANAARRYLAYADQAEREAYGSVACLFRLAARAESVHMERHAWALLGLGATPVYRPDELTVGSTAANLERAIEVEMTERLAAYPWLAGFPRAEFRYEALESLNDARGAEASHERVFRAARASLDSAGPLLASHAWCSPSLPDERESACYTLCHGDGSVFAGRLTRCPICGCAGTLLETRECAP